MIKLKEEYSLKPEDRHLSGFWLDLGSRVEKDATWARIEWLVDQHLILLKSSEENFDSLYRDPCDNRLWEKIHIAPDLLDGGPPTLRVISTAEAVRKYGEFS